MLIELCDCLRNIVSSLEYSNWRKNHSPLIKEIAVFQTWQTWQTIPHAQSAYLSATDSVAKVMDWLMLRIRYARAFANLKNSGTKKEKNKTNESKHRFVFAENERNPCFLQRSIRFNRPNADSQWALKVIVLSVQIDAIVSKKYHT